jgi:hypothetical protein
MRAYPIDPRDTGWEVSQPAYRVYFWEKQRDYEDSGWASEEWELQDADISEVLDWRKEKAKGRPSVLYACVKHGGELGLVRLSGTDPTEVR